MVDSITTEGGTSTGIFIIGGPQITLRNPTVNNPKADGIHAARGTTDLAIVSPKVSGAGDDCIGIVGVLSAEGRATFSPVNRVTITDPVLTGTAPLGSGIALVGCTNATVTGGVIEGMAKSGVKASTDAVAAATTRPRGITISGTIVRNCADHGVLIGSSDDVVVTGVHSTGNGDCGVAFVDATRALVTGGKFRSNVGFGAYQASGTGNNVVGADLRGNTAGASQGAATLTSCITA